MSRGLIEGEAARPIASVTGYHGGHCVVEPIDRAMLLPVGMALYSGAQAAVPDTHRIVSVELLKEIQVYLSSNRLSNQLRAIIDKESGK
jgi:hypothetical protein